MRHNRVRDLEAALMREVCHNVQVEPELQPTERDGPPRRGNTAEKTRLDVAGVGVWGAYEKTFLDIRIMHPNSPSYVNKPIKDVYVSHEQEKKGNTMSVCYKSRKEHSRPSLDPHLVDRVMRQTGIIKGLQPSLQQRGTKNTQTSSTTSGHA